MTYTDEQQAAIAHAGGHSLTYAVAGSGKTHMLVGRVRLLLERGIPSECIRVLAFNKSAATEFEARLALALPPGLEPPQVSTFHSLGMSLTLRFEEAGLLPRRRLEESESAEKKLAREALALALDAEGTGNYPSQDDVEAFRAFVGLVKSDLHPPGPAFKAFGIDPGYDYFVRAYDLFERARERAAVRFFADLQSEPVALMRTDRRALAMATNRLDVVLVDEFQDVSRIQVELLRQLVGTRASLNAVGDDSQCIYAWRGSRPEWMGKEFDRYFPNAARYTLSRTFRFGHRVSLAAAMLIANNRNRVDTICVSAPSTPDTRIDAIRATCAGDQSAVAAAIAEWRDGGRPLRECAVLSRLWAQTLGLELALIERGIPYRKPKGHFFAIREVVGLLGWLRLAAGTLFDDPRAPGYLRAMLATPTLWIPSASIGEIADEIARDPGEARALLLARAAKTRAGQRAARLRERAELFAEVPGWGDLSAADALRQYASRTALSAVFVRASGSANASEKELAFQTLLGWALRTGSGVRDFLARMDGLRDARQALAPATDDDDAVSLLTIHQAKGLEWPFVVVTGLEAGQFPSERSGIEEERRLAYVAFTRAMERLALAVPPDERFDAAWGLGEAPDAGLPRTRASRFVFESEPRTAAALGAVIAGRLSGTDPQAALPAAPPSAAAIAVLNRYLDEVGIAERYAPPAQPQPEPAVERPWEPNDRIRHSVFGEGRVVGFVDRNTLAIDFGGQRRSIRLGVVPLERVA